MPNHTTSRSIPLPCMIYTMPTQHNTLFITIIHIDAGQGSVAANRWKLCLALECVYNHFIIMWSWESFHCHQTLFDLNQCFQIPVIQRHMLPYLLQVLWNISIGYKKGWIRHLALNLYTLALLRCSLRVTIMKSLNPISNPSLSWLFPNRSQMVLIGQIWENVWRFWGFWLKGGRLCLWAITNRGHHGSALTLQGQWKSLKEEGGNDILVWDISGCPFIDMELVEFIEDAKTIQIFGEWMGISPPKPSPVTCPEWNHMWPAGCLAESPFHLLADEAWAPQSFNQSINHLGQ